MNRTLITGALGFFGSSFVRNVHPNTRGGDLVLLARPSSKRFIRRLGPYEFLSDQIRWLDFSRDDVSDAVADVEQIIHFGARTFVDRSISDPSSFIECNVVGTYKLLEAARLSRTIEKVYIQSTDEVYGAILEGAYKEDARLNPSNPYSATKAAADCLALGYANTYGLNVVIGRAENLYGPYQGREKVLPTFVRKALASEKLPVYGDGKHRRQWLHVDDAVQAILKILEVGQRGEIYHLAGHQELENIELAKIVLRSLGLPEDRWELVPDHNVRPGHDRRYSLDTTKILSTGWKPKYTIETGMPEVVSWYSSNQWWTNA